MNELLMMEVGGVLLIAARIAGLVAVAPLSWSFAPARVRGALVVLLTMLLASQHIAIGPSSPFDIALCTVAELGTGIALGMVVRTTVAVAEIAGDVIGPSMGLGVAQLFDPHAQMSQTAISSLMRHFAILFLLLAGVHRSVLFGLIQSFQWLPTGSLVDATRATPALLTCGAHALAGGVRLALPIVGTLLMVQLSLAFVARAAPALQIFSVGFAVTLAVGVACLLLFLGDFAYQMAVEGSHLDERFAEVLALIGGKT